MFQELYPVARHTPLTLIITPRGERLQVIVIPKPGEDDADKKSALREPISALGTPAELDAELPAKLAEYAAKINELRTAIELPLEAIDAETQKAGKRKPRAEKKPKAAKRAKPAMAAKPAKKPKPAAARKPAKEIKLPGAKSPKAAKPAAARATKTPASKTPTPRASLPGKDQCLEDLRAYRDAVFSGAKYPTTDENLSRAPFIAWARKNGNKTGRRFEKLWAGWHEFLDDNRHFLASGKTTGSEAPHSDAPPSSNAAEPSAASRKTAVVSDSPGTKEVKTALNPKAAWPFPTDECKVLAAKPAAPAGEDMGATLRDLEQKFGTGNDTGHDLYDAAGKYLSSITTEPEIGRTLRLSGHAHPLRITAIEGKRVTVVPEKPAPKPAIRTVHTDTGTLLGNCGEKLTIGDKYAHPEFGDFRVVKVEDEKYTVQRFPEQPAAADQAGMFTAEGSK